MLHNTSLKRWQTRLLSRSVPLVRAPVLWLALAVLVTATLLLATRWAVQGKAPVPADLFMQSVVKRDGQLGWQQLCPALQAQLPLSTLTSQLQQQRNPESRQG